MTNIKLIVKQLNRFWKHILPLCIFTTAVFAQNMIFHHISIDQGMSQNTVESIIQDRNGFMWFGTQDGLNRYDGHRFYILRKNRGNQNSLSDNFITTLFEDHQGQIWIGTNSGGLNCYRPGDKSFIQYIHDPNNQHSIGNNNIRSINENASGQILIGTMGGGLSIFNPETEDFTNFVHDPDNIHSISNNNVRCIFIDHRDQVWLGTEGGGINRMELADDGNPGFYHYMHDPRSRNSLSDNEVTTIIELKPGILLAGTINGGLNRIDVENNEFRHFLNDENNPQSLSGNQINAIYKDRDGRIWIGTDNNGLNSYDDASGRFTRFKYNSFSISTISSNQILSICEDRSGLIWIGTRDRGINKVHPRGNKFTHYKNIPGNTNSLGFNTIRSIQSDDPNILWLGTFGGGLDKFDRVNRYFTHFRSSIFNPYGLNNNHISSLCVDREGVLWVGTWGGGLNKRVGTSSFKHYTHHPDDHSTISDDCVHVLYEDNKQGMWIGTENGLNYFDKQTEKFTNFFYDPQDLNSLSDNRIQSNCIKQDKYDNLWVGTWNGLNRIILSENKRSIKKVVRYTSDPFDMNSLSDNRVISLLIDNEPTEEDIITVWIGTYTGGLNKFVTRNSNFVDPKANQFYHYGIEEGLPNDVIYGLLKDKQGNIWMSTNNGLCRLNKNAAYGDLINIYTASDGLQSNQFFWGASHQNKAGEMIFGGINGFNIFHPDSIRVNTHIPPVIITQFKKNNEIVDFGKEISDLTKIDLTYRDNVFSFEFAALDYSTPAKNQYAYMMEGFDKTWIFTGNKHEATYTNLDPGNYIFRVKGSNSDGNWNEEGASVKINIAPPWWITLWFRLLVFAVLIAAILSLYKIRLADIKKRNKELEEHNIKLNEQIAESQRLQNQLTQAQKMESIGILAGGVAHDFNNLLTVINGHAELGLTKNDIKAIQKDLKSILISGKRAIALTSQLLAFSRKQVIQPVATNVNLVIQNIENMLLSLIGEDITLETDLDSSVPDTIADIGQLEQIIMNLTINARDAINENGNAKTNKLIIIKTNLVNLDQEQFKNNMTGSSGAHILITVSDTGIGMDTETQNKIFDPFFTTKEQGKGTGLGLSTVYGIVNQNNAGISVYSEPDIGTSIKIYWPIHEIPEEEKTPADETATIKPGKEIILLVEDDEHVRTFVHESLSGMGYTVHTSPDGHQAIKFLKKNSGRIDLLVTDMIMPGINGQELAKRAQELRPDLKVLYSSGYTDNHIVSKGFLKKGLNFIQKPYSINELSLKVRKILDIPG